MTRQSNSASLTDAYPALRALYGAANANVRLHEHSERPKHLACDSPRHPRQPGDGDCGLPVLGLFRWHCGSLDACRSRVLRKRGWVL